MTQTVQDVAKQLEATSSAEKIIKIRVVGGPPAADVSLEYVGERPHSRSTQTVPAPVAQSSDVEVTGTPMEQGASGARTAGARSESLVIQTKNLETGQGVTLLQVKHFPDAFAATMEAYQIAARLTILVEKREKR